MLALHVPAKNLRWGLNSPASKVQRHCCWWWSRWIVVKSHLGGSRDLAARARAPPRFKLSGRPLRPSTAPSQKLESSTCCSALLIKSSPLPLVPFTPPRLVGLEEVVHLHEESLLPSVGRPVARDNTGFASCSRFASMHHVLRSNSDGEVDKGSTRPTDIAVPLRADLSPMIAIHHIQSLPIRSRAIRWITTDGARILAQPSESCDGIHRLLIQLRLIA